MCVCGVRSASGLDLIMDSLLGDFFDVGYTNLAATGRVVRVRAMGSCARLCHCGCALQLSSLGWSGPRVTHALAQIVFGAGSMTTYGDRPNWPQLAWRWCWRPRLGARSPAARRAANRSRPRRRPAGDDQRQPLSDVLQPHLSVGPPGRHGRHGGRGPRHGPARARGEWDRGLPPLLQPALLAER